MNIPKTIEWVGGLTDGFVQMIDQTLLPSRLELIECRDTPRMWEAIRSLRVRGAPAIGIAGAMGLVLGVRFVAGDDEAVLLRELDKQKAYLASARPTAVNLFWALDRLARVAEQTRGRGTEAIKHTLWAESLAIRDEDAASCRAIGEFGAALMPDSGGVLTHCNAGGLATSELGTALAVLVTAHRGGKRLRVYSDETRPLLQGSRLTAWELLQHGVDVTTICDSMAAQVMKEGRVQCVVTGADRIAANGDTANKIGTYGLALLAAAHDIPFYVAAPASTFDLSCPDGAAIPIEQRDPDEVRCIAGQPIAPAQVAVYNPAFDVTPADLISALITDRGLIQPVTRDTIATVLGPSSPAEP